MGTLSISAATASDLTNRVEDYEVASMNTDGVQDQDETTYQNSKWAQQWGYFNSIPEMKSAILMKAIWNVGKGYTTDSRTKVILEQITGMGKDTFLEIILNMEVTKRIGGDAFAEIIRDDKGVLINLKTLDPATMKLVFDRRGIIKRYEQVSKTNGNPTIKFKPTDIF